jgi:magnesium-transporting ATPase (P-type)
MADGIKFDNNDSNEKKVGNVTLTEHTGTRASSVDTSRTDRKSLLKSVLMRKKNFISKKSQNNGPVVEGPPYHTMKIETVVQLMKSDLEDGLTEKQVEERRGEYGFNEMEGDGGVNPFKLMLKQFFNVMVLILVIAMAVSFAFKDWIEAGVIAFIMLLNAGIGFMQEYKAEKTMESLRQMASPTAQVIREGHQKTVATRDLIPGDIIILKNGDVVGADCRIIEYAYLSSFI